MSLQRNIAAEYDFFNGLLGDVKLYYDWDWPGAERDLRRALELNPSLAEAHYHYGWYLDLMGRRDDALAEMKRAQEIDPLSPLFTAWLGGYYVALGQYDDALEEARKALEMNPNFPVGHYTLGLALAGKGMYEEAIAAHKKATGIFSPLRDGLGVAYAQAGMGNEARRILAEMQKDATAGDAFSLAHVYTALEEKDEAFRHLEDAFEFRYSMLPWVGTDPWFRPLRDDPRLEDLLRRMNVPLTRLQRK